MILSIGKPDGEVEAALGLTTAIDSTRPDGKFITILEKAAEAVVKAATKRNFEERTFTDEAFDIDKEQDRILLTDRPLSVFTSLKYVTSVNSDGTLVSQAYNLNEYYVDKPAGIVALYSGFFPSGRQTVLCSYKAGWTPTDIANTASDDLASVKSLIASVLRRKRDLIDKGMEHLAAVGFGDESATLQFSFSAADKIIIDQLARD